MSVVEDAQQIVGHMLLSAIRALVKVMEEDADVFKVVDELRAVELEVHNARRELEKVIFGG